MSSPSPLAMPFKLRRMSPSTSSSMLMDRVIRDLGGTAPYSPPSSLHLMRRKECQTGDYFDDPDWTAYNQQHEVKDATYPWQCPTHPLPYPHQPLPSLMTKFAAHALRGDAPLSYSPSPYSCASQPIYFCSRGDTSTDDGEEYDLESMDIHIRETYFATSAERGRWLSSPMPSRVRSQAAPPMCGHSSPIESLSDASPLRGHSWRHKWSHSVDEQTLTSSEDHDEDACCSSSLPPSSPLASPISRLSFLSDDCGGDSVVDPRFKSDDCHSLTATPELSISSTTCTSPVEPTRTPALHEVCATVLAHQPQDFPCHSANSDIPHHTSACTPKAVDVHTHSATNPELDCILSPLSQFELDLPEEPPKLPLSDTVNKPCPGVDASWKQDVPQPVQSLSNRERLGVSLDTIGGSNSNRKAKKGGPNAGNPAAVHTRKRGVVRAGSPSSDPKRRRGTKSHSTNRPEPPSKKTKLSRCKDDFLEGREAKSVPRQRGTSKSKRSVRSPSRPSAEGCNPESARPSTTRASMDAVDVEFHASLTGMLIEVLATSRATSMDASTLYLVLTQAHPCFTAERPKEELLVDIATVLEAGRTRCGMFEKVDGSGERSRHKAFENRWFYVPERDEDRERASLISAIMPRQKRNETKKYKQYYYRPLDKISRWDPEDAP